MSYHDTKCVTCRNWKNHGSCRLGEACNFLHAWVQPRKKGICLKYLRNECHRYECHFQHLDIKLHEYEEASISANSYAELKENIYKVHGEQVYCGNVDDENKLPVIDDKVVECNHWIKGRSCSPECLFLHAWVDTTKEGICCKHLRGLCCKSEAACPFQHLNMSVTEYEKLAEGTNSFEELREKISNNARRFRRNHKIIIDEEAILVKPERKDVAKKLIATDKKGNNNDVVIHDRGGIPYFICPITKDVMEDPVITSAGLTYSRKGIEKWFSSGQKTDFMTRTELKSMKLIPNYILKSQIQAWKEVEKKKYNNNDVAIHDFYICSITDTVMEDPVVTLAGQTYSRKAIEEWFSRGKITDPLTRMDLKSTQLIPNCNLKSQIREWKQAQKNKEVNVKQEYDLRPMEQIDTVKCKQNRWYETKMVDWTVEHNREFIKQQGQSPIWEEYANKLFNERIDGSTMSLYLEIKTLREDFDYIKTAFARKICNSIKEQLSEE